MEVIHTNTSLNMVLGILTFCGFWMPPSFAGTWKATFYGIFSCFMFVGTLIIYLITEGMDIYMNLGNIEKNTETALLAITVFVTFLKATKIIVEREEIQRIVDKFDEPSFSSVSKANSKYLLNAMMLTNLYTKVLSCAAFGTAILWSVLPLFDKSGEHKLPLRAWYPWDESVQSTFIMLYIYQAISIGILALLNSAQDVLICSLMILICGQLDVLYSDISALGSDDRTSGQGNSTMDSATSHEVNVSKTGDIKWRLRRLIMHQNDLINCIKKLEELFGGALLIQFVGSCTAICATAFKLSVTRFSIEFLSDFFFLCTVLAELFIFCYPGSELMIKSVRISEAAYNTPWYTQDIAFRKMLIILIERSKHPITITAGGVMPLTLGTLTSILRSSYSYYAVLKTIHDV